MVDLPGRSVTGQLIDGAVQGKDTPYSTEEAGRSAGAIAAVERPNWLCCVSMWEARDENSRSAPHFVKTT